MMRITRPIIFISVVLAMLIYCPLAFSQTQPKLSVDEDIASPSLALDPQTTAPDPTGVEGRIYYDDNDDEVYISRFDGSSWYWDSIGGAARNVATIIVAASDSLDIDKADTGYQCDGTDDQEEINRAINNLPASGGAVYLLEGTYNITGTPKPDTTIPPDASLPDDQVETTPGIVLDKDNISLIGAGKGTVLNVAVSADFNVIHADTVNYLLISQLMIEGNGVSVTGINYGIFFNSVTNSKINRVWVENMTFLGIYLSYSDNNTISGNHIQSNLSNGINLQYSNNNTISSNNIQGNGQMGINLYSSANNIVSSNNLQSNSRNIELYEQANNNIISGNNIQGSTNWGIFVRKAYNNIISGNNIRASNVGIYLSYNTADTSYNVISANTIQSDNYSGIALGFRVRNNIISSNVIYNSRGGIALGDRVNDRNLISFNHISDIGVYDGIRIDFANYYNYLVANYIDGSSLIIDSGAGTIYTDKAKITLEKKGIDISSSSYNLDVATNPQTYVSLNPSVDITTLTLANGKSAGDLLIIENGSVTDKSIIIREADNPNLNLEQPDFLTLTQYDTLELIWNGDAISPRWVEVSYTDIP